MNKSLVSAFIDMFAKLATAIFFFSSIYICIFSGIHGSVSLSYIWGVLLLSAILTAARLPFLKEKEMPRIPFLLWNIVYSVFANGVVLATGLWLGWFSLAHPITIIAMELLFVVIFITVWVVMYLSLRHSTEKMNSQLQKFKN